MPNRHDLRPAHASEYYQYLPGANSIAARIATYQRARMFARFIDCFGAVPSHTVVDVGVTSNEVYELDNYFEMLYPHKDRITAVGLEDGVHLERKYPGLRFIRMAPGPLPFSDRSFDIAHSSAVIEHAGQRENQVAFLRELWRVSARGIFITTPNRWFPVEFHTMVPLVHWLPANTFRRLLRAIGRDFYALEANLNLMSRTDLSNAAREAGITTFRVEDVSLALWPTNLLLIGHKS